MRRLKILLALAAIAAAGAAFAHGEKPHAQRSENRAISTEEKAFGREGDPKRATRTIRIDMNDRMRFNPATIQVKRGEVVRFEVKNSGKTMHEMVLGTMQELKEHAELMRKHPGMEHDEPYMAHVGPGKTGEIVWNFNRAGEFEFACLIAGHYQGGMVGTIKVAPGGKA
jgi:uncharacterized cupredoxin-like copper-binding protein